MRVRYESKGNPNPLPQKAPGAKTAALRERLAAAKESEGEESSQGEGDGGDGWSDKIKGMLGSDEEVGFGAPI